MKKIYVIPATIIMQAEAEQILASSGVISSNSDISIGYGGVDEGGDIDPNVKESNFDFSWD